MCFIAIMQLKGVNVIDEGKSGSRGVVNGEKS